MKNKTTKKEQGRYCYLPALNFLSDNSGFLFKNGTFSYK